MTVRGTPFATPDIAKSNRTLLVSTLLRACLLLWVWRRVWVVVLMVPWRRNLLYCHHSRSSNWHTGRRALPQPLRPTSLSVTLVPAGTSCAGAMDGGTPAQAGCGPPDPVRQAACFQGLCWRRSFKLWPLEACEPMTATDRARSAPRRCASHEPGNLKRTSVGEAVCGTPPRGE